MRGWLGAGLLVLALTLAACAAPAPVTEEAPPREGRGVGEAPATPPPPRPPHKPPVPESESTQATAATTDEAAASSGDASSASTAAPSTPPEPAAPEASTPPDQPTAPVTAAQPAQPSPPQTASVEAPVLPPPAPPPPRLTGLNQAQVRTLLGTPGGREDAAPATIWRYSGRNCELAIYFYFDLKSQVMRALHYEVDNHGSNELTGERCFAELIAAHQANPQGSPGADPPR